MNFFNSFDKFLVVNKNRKSVFILHRVNRSKKFNY